MGDFAYDVVIEEVRQRAKEDRFCARIMNLVRLHAGDTVPADAELQAAYGATPAEAFAEIEATMERWVKGQTN